MKVSVSSTVLAVTLAGALTVAGYAQAPAAAPATAPATQPGFATLKEKVSYIFGTQIGQKIKQEGIDVDVRVLARGVADAQSGATPALSPQQMREAMTEFQKEMTRKTEEQAQKNLQEGKAFLEKNKTANGFAVTASGLQYKVVQEGKGDAPKLGDTATVHYRGTFIDGTEFDSSYKRGQPASFVVGEVIPGWNEGLQMMKVGAKYKLAIPAALAYGPRGQGGAIPPNAVLLFEVELLDVKPTPAAPDMQGMPGMPTH